MLKNLRLFFPDRLSDNLRFIAYILGRSNGKKYHLASSDVRVDRYFTRRRFPNCSRKNKSTILGAKALVR
jgi:hypothetical protein